MKDKKKVTKFIDELKDEISVFWMQGKPKAVSTVCPHFGGEFDYDSSKDILRCRWHGWKFDLNTCQSLAQWESYEETSLVGKILKNAHEPLGCFPFKGKLQSYDLHINNDRIEIIIPLTT
ncbi:MAG: Rieske 2Fe-2S domain-containing protein [Bacteroidetes bacterium]|nr:Rieske 2Fe-2S domain-containing protein [Bacteroidota bacterium]